MAPIRLDASHFSPDTRAFLESLAAKEVRYLIVGGEAVILHGHVRLTGDVDFFFARDRENLDRLFSALEEFWAGDIPASDPPAISRRWPRDSVRASPNRIDLVNDIDGVSFNEAWPGRMDAVISTERGEVVLSSGARLW